MQQPTIQNTIHVPTIIITTDVDTLLPVAATKMAKNGIHHLVVTERDEIVGILSDRDLFMEETRKPARESHDLGSPRKVSDVMTPVCERITETTSVRAAIDIMAAHGCSALPVMRDSGLVGIVTESDLIELLAKILAATAVASKAEDTAKIAFSNPIVQQAMYCIAQAGL